MGGFLSRRIKADLSLLFVVIIWGSTFAFMKDIFNTITPFYFLTLRFSFATAVLGMIFYKKVKQLDLNTFKYGLFAGVFLFGGYGLQVTGLKLTDASKAGFITGLAVVLVPILSAIIFKKMPELTTSIGVILATIGLALLTFNGRLLFNLGDFLVFLSAFSLAIHILLVDRYVKSKDAILFTIIQIGTVALLSGISTLLEGSYVLVTDISIWTNVIYMGLFATALALIVQNKAQQFTTATRTAIIFVMEPVFGALFAYLYLGELISAKGYWGGVLIVLGMLFAELKFENIKNFLVRKKEIKEVS
ncbi:drug/metabolite transporter (DMT)-like permease [Orenia metallireducens]|uniref:Permease of the drug/metabolite transporter (DMT) superfamily n=1 Tax=Orenia metallireducens TaxID=1413210 RepID=A0A285HI13_9FIRM|nr:DMT family transporter [Orenia metallireducens]PRX27213.1 drug/metabolite transporter (DMT)-like permease [Orenia metallireducens]SNY35400.1 Permease of the drug/metabolite transporter (DMT) superfamily [Orenia metallireducens]